MKKEPTPRGPFKLHFARTREDIRHVYENGPSSCLSNPAKHYLSRPIHPVEALAAGDIEVAYIQDHIGIAARTLVYPRKMVYLTPIYAEWGTGTAVLLEQMLAVRGYKEARRREFDGARLLKFPVTVPMPKHEHPSIAGIWPCWCFSCQVHRLGRPVNTYIAPGIDCTYDGISVGDDYLYVGKVRGLPCTQPDHDKGVLL